MGVASQSLQGKGSGRCGGRALGTANRIYYNVQPTVRVLGERLASSRLVFGMARGAMAFPCLLWPAADPVKFEVIFDTVLGGETSK